MTDTDERQRKLDAEIARIKAFIEILPRDEKGRLIYRLKEPVTLGSDTISELHIRKVKSGDMRRMPEADRTIGHTLDLIGRVTAQPPPVIDELGREDLEEVSSIVGVF